MFLKSIHIKNYRQFENLGLDLTYPKGHKKEGEPLEKICIIGDNGTGKTTLLDLILNYYWHGFDKGDLPNPFYLEYTTVDFRQDTELKFTNTKHPINLKQEYADVNAKILFFPTGINLPSSLKEKEDTINAEDAAKKSIYDLNNSETLKIWEQLRSSMKPSIEKELLYRLESLKGMKNQNDIHELKTVLSKIEKFKADNQNDYDKFAEFLNPLLRRFHLKLNTKIDLDKFDEIRFLDLRAKDGTIIPMEKWSTGIRQLIYTILPLYALKPETGIIMIDEAENSLYPNTQRSIIDFYKSVCPDMQLIIATHSPILASSFEPWEVIELKFNEKGKVERKPYFKGENHVDNYHIRPMYLQWDSLFMKMFGLDTDSNEERNDMLMELAILKRDLKKSSGADKEALQEKYETLAEQLDWATL